VNPRAQALLGAAGILLTLGAQELVARARHRQPGGLPARSTRWRSAARCRRRTWPCWISPAHRAGVRRRRVAGVVIAIAGGGIARWAIWLRPVVSAAPIRRWPGFRWPSSGSGWANLRIFVIFLGAFFRCDQHLERHANIDDAAARGRRWVSPDGLLLKSPRHAADIATGLRIGWGWPSACWSPPS
jgi:hypothetical protein